MITRTHAVLSALLVVQCVVIAFVVAPWGRDAEGASAPLLPEIATEDPARLTIEAAGDARVVIERAATGYVLPAYGGYPADGERVRALLEVLRGAKARTPVATRARSHATLRVADDAFERRVTLGVAGGGAKAEGGQDLTLFVGTSPQYQVHNVRRAGDDRVFEARGLALWQLDTKADAWIEHSLVEVPYERVTKVALENARGRFSLEREGDGWTLRDTSGAALAVDATKAEALVRELSSIWVARPVGARDDAAHGLASPAARIALTLGPNAAVAGEEAAGAAVEERVILVGSALAGDEGLRHVALADGAVTAAASEGALTRALSATIDDVRAP